MEFLETLMVQLKDAGMEVKYDGLYLVVAGCKFDVESAKRSTKNKAATIVKFLGSRFLVDPDGQFDATRAVGLVIAELPKRLKEKEQYNRYMACRKAVYEAFPDAPTECEQSPYKDWKRVNDGVYVGWSSAGIEVKYVVQSIDKAKKLVEVRNGLTA